MPRAISFWASAPATPARLAFSTSNTASYEDERGSGCGRRGMRGILAGRQVETQSWRPDAEIHANAIRGQAPSERKRDGRTSQKRGFDYETCSDARQRIPVIDGWARRTARGRHARRAILEDASFAPA